MGDKGYSRVPQPGAAARVIHSAAQTGVLSSTVCHPRHLWHFKPMLVLHTVALQTTKEVQVTRGAGNFRWIILGPGKPVFNRT